MFEVDSHQGKPMPIDTAMVRLRARMPWAEKCDARSIGEAAAAAAELAASAYHRAEPSARRHAETMLYFLSIDARFAVPADPIVAVIWTTLMQAKLFELRRDVGAYESRDLSSADMQAELENAVARWGAFNHPLLDVLEKRDHRAYDIWAKNWIGSCFGFSSQLSSLVQRTTGQAKRAVLENLSDELTDSATHDTLRTRFYESLGLEYSAETIVLDSDWVIEATEVLTLRTGLCNMPDPLPALGCFYGVEANWPSECKRHHAMNKARGADDHTLEYWTTHAFADEHHSSDWLDAVKTGCATSAQRAAVVEGALMQLKLRWRMYDAMLVKVNALARADA